MFQFVRDIWNPVCPCTSGKRWHQFCVRYPGPGISMRNRIKLAVQNRNPSRLIGLAVFIGLCCEAWWKMARYGLRQAFGRKSEATPIRQAKRKSA